ncbi:SCO family protein [Chakrabartia godavariana]|nr:SCO family protein [Chakrabartia godavariana]
MNKFKIIAAGLALSVLSACGGAPAEAPPLAGAKMGGAFRLTNQDGKTVTDADFAGKYRLVYFGYTFCPDVCPVDVQIMGQGLSAFEKADPARGGKVVPIFITVDPARDTPAAIKQFVSNFHPRMVGLTGPVKDIDAVAQAYGVAFMRQPPNAQGAYLVDHARMVVLYGPAGEPIAIMPQNAKPQQFADELARWVK